MHHWGAHDHAGVSQDTEVVLYSLRPIKSDVLDSVSSYLIVRLIQKFCININYFAMTYFIIRNTLTIIYLFYNLQKKKNE
jgi:hypothetical protein